MIEENQRSVQENNTVTLQVLSSHHRHPVALSRRDFSFQAFNLRRKAYLESRKSARVRYYNHKALRRGLTRGYMPVNTVEKGSGEDATTLRVLDEIGMHADRSQKRQRENADELGLILSEDYRELATLPARSTVQLLDRLIRKHIVPRAARAGIPLTRSSLQFSFYAFHKDRLVVVGSPYSHAGRSIWGFSSDLRTEAGGDFVIYLN